MHVTQESPSSAVLDISGGLARLLESQLPHTSTETNMMPALPTEAPRLEQSPTLGTIGGGPMQLHAPRMPGGRAPG